MTTSEVAGFAVEVSPDGPAETVVLIHGAISPRGLRPLLDCQALTDRYRLAHYDRRGYAGGPPSRSIEEMASDTAVVARAVATGPTHLVGHSIGAVVALQVALDRPELVGSLTLIEPTWATREELLGLFRHAIQGAVDAYTTGRPEDAADHMLRVLDGQDYRTSLAAILPPDWPAGAGHVMSLYFEHDLPAAVAWHLSQAQAATIRQPTLIVRGQRAPALFAEVAADVRTLLPHATEIVIPGATHNVAATAPDATARALLSFVAALNVDS